MKPGKTDYQYQVISRIKQLRIAHNYSQVKLAEYLCISNGLVGNIESLRFRHKYTLYQISRVAQLFGVSIPFLFLGEECDDINTILNKIIEYDR